MKVSLGLVTMVMVTFAAIILQEKSLVAALFSFDFKFILNFGVDFLHKHGYESKEVSLFQQAFNKGGSYVNDNYHGNNRLTLFFFKDPPEEICSIQKVFLNDDSSHTELMKAHLIEGAWTMEELYKKRTIRNLKGDYITFGKSPEGLMMANGRHIKESNINMGNNVMGHMMEEPLYLPSQKYPIQDVIPAVVAHRIPTYNFPSGLEAGPAIRLYVQYIIKAFFFTFKITKETKLTFIQPSRKEMHQLFHGHHALSPVIVTSAFSHVLKKCIFIGEIPPHNPTYASGIKNALGEEVEIMKTSAGCYKIGDIEVDPTETMYGENGLIYFPREDDYTFTEDGGLVRSKDADQDYVQTKTANAESEIAAVAADAEAEAALETFSNSASDTSAGVVPKSNINGSNAQAVLGASGDAATDVQSTLQTSGETAAAANAQGEMGASLV